MKTSHNKILPLVSCTCFDNSFLQRNRLHKPQPTSHSPYHPIL